MRINIKLIVLALSYIKLVINALIKKENNNVEIAEVNNKINTNEWLNQKLSLGVANNYFSGRSG